MYKNIKIEKTKYIKDQLDQVVDKSFNYFKKESTESSRMTIEEFFEVYEELYLDIPAEGDVNSHEYLVKKSGELAGLSTTTEDIDPLLDEIAELREQLLFANEQILQLQTDNIKNG